ncbi:NEQ323 [Nanoarchaeum equitans Kin4-M]|uniref:Translation initiation factor 2 subunit beta n=1 Tax=Nanoarchaeum equitans (strain Kin4-M) TaxID=228908 RepID=IF2B_NANEQ|nr:RecName: Full=Translation initiation factor 2 subunit beta; AltName: Full=aIF2-beta; AltName: Full=eIF-2-beta [Nanoarchaeum equitans Kin4-M]AAR39172.1 NEQ323 [Nanoarchaeum equitans Kin4-M]
MEYNYFELLERAYQKLKDVIKQEQIRWNPPIPHIEYVKNRTIITNFKQIANYLNRDPKIIAKFFSKELFVQTIIEGNSLIINKRVSYETIKKKLDEFINIFVICPVCKRPDTELIERGRKIYYIKCHACGSESPVNYEL